MLAKLAAFKADYLFPGYTDAPLYDIVRQATERKLLPQVLHGARLARPGHEEQGRHRGLHRLRAEVLRGSREDVAEGAKVHGRLQGLLQARLPLRPGAAVLVVLLRPRLHAGRGDEEGRHAWTTSAKVRAALLSITYSGMWTIKFDPKGEQIFDFDIAHMKKGGAIRSIALSPDVGGQRGFRRGSKASSHPRPPRRRSKPYRVNADDATHSRAAAQRHHRRDASTASSPWASH